MKKLVALFISVFMISLSACAERFEEGKHYEVISQKGSSGKQVTEFFSFGCPHCFRFDPTWNDITSKLPEDIKVNKSHVTFLRYASKEIQEDLSRALVVAEILKVDKKVVPALFNYINVQRATFSSRQDIRNVFVLNGVSGEDFDKYIDSFSVNSAIRRMDVDAKELGINGVPMVIVNNKYKILGGVSSAQEYADLVAYLAAKS